MRHPNRSTGEEHRTERYETPQSGTDVRASVEECSNSGAISVFDEGP